MKRKRIGNNNNNNNKESAYGYYTIYQRPMSDHRSKKVPTYIVLRCVQRDWILNGHCVSDRQKTDAEH